MSVTESMDRISVAIEKKVSETLNPPKDKIKKPHNRLWIALILFTAIFAFLDLLTGVSVGYSTRWYYGVLVVLSGFVTMVAHELLYTNPYAGFWQKVISAVGFMASVLITGVIGVTAIGLNLLFTGYDREVTGAVMVGVSFLTLFFHGFLGAVYFFTDSGIASRQAASKKMADHEKIMKDFALAAQIVKAGKDIEKELMDAVKNGDGNRLGRALNSIPGEEWVNEDFQTAGREK